MKKPVIPYYLFIGTYPSCYVYCDQTKEKNGDFKEIGRIYYSPLKMEIYDFSEKHVQAHKIIKDKFEELKTKTSIVVSTCGQTAAINYSPQTV